MILSVSRRTDIPAFFSEWFYKRISEGFYMVRNPMNTRQISKVNIKPDVVDCIVFWTKNPKPMLARLNELEAYKYYFQYTITGYGKEMEPHVPDLHELIETFQNLSDKIGQDRVIWRYDPIIFSYEYTTEYHLKRFKEVAEQLKGFTKKCVISFVDIYTSKNMSNMNDIHYKEISNDAINQFAKSLAEIAKDNGMVVGTCAEKIDLSFCGIEHNSCIDKNLIESIIGYELKVGPDGQRSECRCVKCDEMGAFDTCLHGCKYCYANYREAVVRENARKYDISSPILCGTVSQKVGDKITERPVKSYKTEKQMEQLTFKFD
ncbi:MAG: DUF1848 domain-containing protein [Lachnospiraceae bacterium]|jgi:DNA repair photolyase|nr:DUF1848 domain-containing protein [Lachnospiraceae bacterium]